MVTPHLLVLYLIKDNGPAWLRWLLRQGGPILAHPKHRDCQSFLKCVRKTLCLFQKRSCRRKEQEEVNDDIGKLLSWILSETKQRRKNELGKNMQSRKRHEKMQKMDLENGAHWEKEEL
jgi:hypothetical protein